MSFNPLAYGTEVAGILTGGTGLAGLVASATPSPVLQRSITDALFAESAHPQGALSGLWLYFDCFDEGHKVAQEDESAEGSFWHGIAHRREPDYGNSSYWLRQVGSHAVFPAVLEAARATPGAGMSLASKWDPFAFVEFCEEAARVGGAQEAWAMAVQRAEWEILFDYCARKRSV